MGSMKQDQLLENACDVTLGCLLCVCSLKALHSAAPAPQYLPMGLCAERLGQNAALQHGEEQGKGRGGQGKGRSHSPEVHQEHVLNLLQDLQLPEHIADLVPLDALLLVHVLHGIHLLSVSLLHNAHLQQKEKI